MLLATVILVPLAWLVSGPPAFEWTAPLTVLFLYAGLPGSALAYWASAMAGRRLPAVTTSLGLLATPAVSIVAAALWLGEQPGVSLLVAVVLILGGVALGAGAERRSDAPVQ
jgi:drug/metabolite transporter (DMT)-like permease